MPDRSKKVAALKRERTKRLAKLGAKVYYLRKRGRDQEMYNMVCDEFVSLGGVYVKFLQGVLFSSPVMRRWQSPNKLKIFENLDTQPLDVIQILRDELPPHQLQEIALIQQEPFAAGSFGQVYLGQHVNGQKIIIKVLRPMVRDLLRYDLRLLSIFGTRFTASEYSNFTIKMTSAIKEFKRATLNETDYIAEAQFANELYEIYKDNPHIVIPKTYLDLCTPHIIVQDYVDGISGAELVRHKEAGEDPAKIVRERLGSDLDTQLMIGGIESIASVFAIPRIPGDPHPGNIRFMTNNRIGLIDFGISAPAPKNRAAFFSLIKEWSLIYEQKSSVSNMFEQFMRYFVNDLYRALKKLSVFTPNLSSMPFAASGDQDAANDSNQSTDLVGVIGGMIQNAFDGATGASDLRALVEDGQLMHTFGQVANKDNRLGLVIRIESSEVLRAAQTFIALLKSLDRFQLYPEILVEAVRTVERDNPDIIHTTENTLTASQAISIINRWLERVALRDPLLFKQLIEYISPREQVAKLETKEAVDA